jgi:phage shock protein PspC (stress-responsive transcriptional regulator)
VVPRYRGDDVVGRLNGMTSALPPSAPPPADPNDGWPPPPPHSPTPRPQLCRSRTDKVLGGVAGGLADYTGIDALLWRVGAIALTFAGGSGIIIYLLLWLLMPAAPGGQVATTAPAGPPAERLPRSPVPRVTLAALLIVLGLGVAVTQFTDLDLGPRGFLGTALLIVGIGLVVSAVTGTGRGAKRGLLILGAVLSVATVLAATVDFDSPRGPVGDRTYTPDTAGAVRPLYEGGAGDLVLDLSGIDPAELRQAVVTEVHHGVGDIDVIVPRDADVRISAMTGVGDLQFDGEAIGEDATFHSGTGSGSWVDDGNPEFQITVHNGLGDVEVSRG